MTRGVPTCKYCGATQPHHAPGCGWAALHKPEEICRHGNEKAACSKCLIDCGNASEQKAFEVWAKNVGFDITRGVSGVTYRDVGTNKAYMGWASRAIKKWWAQ